MEKRVKSVKSDINQSRIIRINKGLVNSQSKKFKIVGYFGDYTDEPGLIIKCLNCNEIKEYKIKRDKPTNLRCKQCRYLEYLVPKFEERKNFDILNCEILSIHKYFKGKSELKEENTDKDE